MIEKKCVLRLVLWSFTSQNRNENEMEMNSTDEDSERIEQDALIPRVLILPKMLIPFALMC